MTETTDDWVLECSDDERFAGWTEVDGEPMPPLDELQRLYARVESGDPPTLAWRCLGRRPLDADAPDEDEDEPVQLPDMSDFDFGGDDVAQPVETPRRQPGAAPRGSAKKKSTSLDKILKNMKRTRELEAKEASEASAADKQKPD
ncbi:PAXIP1-associated glutamate-rich protein 1-like [Pollicipes pollicipes]|uniref:PAXIP1-associated glutamate-rich protein 1-like n=1 Tax=Pollicipes pollicipes TaxID=41117 RepID=UPI00188568F2|nr:PAXIP1-associated glutamate-rich protein 1-like [Pollicipes pollicipes]